MKWHKKSCSITEQPMPKMAIYNRNSALQRKWTIPNPQVP